MAAQSLVEEINHRPNSRRVPYPLVCEEPESPLMVGSGRKASNEVGIGVSDDARQDRDSETRADSRKQPSRCRVVHGDLLFETEGLQPAW